MTRTTLLLAVLTLMALPTALFAHAVGVSCTVRHDRLEIEGFYDDDTPAFKAKVTLVNVQDEVIATGITDANGRCTLARPAAGQYEVRLDAGAGHRAKTTLVVPDALPEPEAAPPIIAGPTRVEFTFPWTRVLIGLAAIGGGCGVVMLIARLRATSQPQSRCNTREG